ncbi:hypothetical protein SAMN05421823_12412 [Catalinimonas alkaloidigena]|uniref:Antitoxin MazE n=1 Tax=Catalinimonas alkaloidigena TaxID=1075417 RepID=A0A1G9VUR3_9BACT|nr:AbrB/MazE/SpoVT family DNA-binding domain-containing protein [Catalinimonas alkaloidigena]SDM75890.1 hypothetical protein SAMN05421823_12412 [Catalinimonas alkaloidigena]
MNAIIDKVRNVSISKAITTPAPFIQQWGLADQVELTLQEGCLIVRPVAGTPHPRMGWEAQFQQALADGHTPNPELLEGFSNDFDQEEW